jgi:hypothetical protein
MGGEGGQPIAAGNKATVFAGMSGEPAPVDGATLVATAIRG